MPRIIPVSERDRPVGDAMKKPDLRKRRFAATRNKIADQPFRKPGQSRKAALRAAADRVDIISQRIAHNAGISPDAFANASETFAPRVTPSAAEPASLLAMGAQKMFFLKEWRIFRGMSQEALAEMVGTSKGYLSQIERSERPWSQHWLEAFAKALSVTPQTLLSEPPPSIGDEMLPPIDRDLMQDCIKYAVEIIAKRRGGRDDCDQFSCEIAAAAISQYCALVGVIDRDKKSA